MAKNQGNKSSAYILASKPKLQGRRKGHILLNLPLFIALSGRGIITL